MSRTLTTTTKIDSKFGSLFTHVEFDLLGKVVGVWVSTSQRHEATDIDGICKAIGVVIHDAIVEVTGE